MRILAVWLLIIFQDLFRNLVKRYLATLVQVYAALKNSERSSWGNKANFVIFLTYGTPSSIWEGPTLIVNKLWDAINQSQLAVNLICNWFGPVIGQSQRLVVRWLFKSSLVNFFKVKAWKRYIDWSHRRRGLNLVLFVVFLYGIKHPYICMWIVILWLDWTVLVTNPFFLDLNILVTCLGSLISLIDVPFLLFHLSEPLLSEVAFDLTVDLAVQGNVSLLMA